MSLGLQSARIYLGRKLAARGAWLLLLLWASAQAALPLWRAEQDGKVVWLLGSIHAAKASIYPLAAPIEAAYAAADSVVVEADVTNSSASAELRNESMLPSGQTLAQVLTPELAQQLQSLALKKGMPAATVERMKPWLLAMVVTMADLGKSGYDPQHGIDMHYLQRAQRDGKSRIELESVRFQFDLMDKLPRDQMIAFVQDALGRHYKKDMLRQVEMISAAWARGDGATLARLMRKQMPAGTAGKSLLQRLVVDRNPAMADKIAALAQPERPPFVIVGIGHLVGSGSVVELLQQRGFQVVQQ